MDVFKNNEVVVMSDEDYNIYGQLDLDQKRYVDYLCEDYNFSVKTAVKELDCNDWNYELTDRTIRSKRPDV